MSLTLIAGAYVFIYLSINVEIFMTDTQNSINVNVWSTCFNSYSSINRDGCGCRTTGSSS